MIIVTIVFIIIIFLLLIYMWMEARENNIVEVQLNEKSYPKSFEPFTLFFISDVHRRIIDEEIINKVKKSAEIVVIGGDLTEKGVPLSRIEENLRRLNQIGPVYFIWGNNDYEMDSYQLGQLLSSYNVKILENTHELIRSDQNEAIYLVGIGETSVENDNLDGAVEGIEHAFKIVVCHNPEIMKKIEEKHNIALILSGHTHGGQIRIFGLGPYSKGRLYTFENTKLLISNGYGTTQFPLRLGAKPETHLITIRGK